MNFLKEFYEIERKAIEIRNKNFDNLFSANHRNAMIQRHGGTMAQIITIEDLLKSI